MQFMLLIDFVLCVKILEISLLFAEKMALETQRSVHGCIISELAVIWFFKNLNL